MATPAQRLVTESALTTALATVRYNSGIHNVAQLAPTLIESGTLQVQRVGDTTWWIATGMKFRADVTGVSQNILEAGVVPVGYRPQGTRWVDLVNDAGQRRRIGYTATGTFQISGGSLAGNRFYFTVPFPTPGPLPTSHPGAPA